MKLYILLAVVFGLTFFTIGLILNRNFADFKSIVGYRTGLAMKNMDTWIEGNSYAGRILMIFASLKLLVITFLPWNNYNSFQLLTYVLCGGLICSLLGVYFLTERYLHGIFFKDGKRRPKF